jgi:hypothetical protein
VIALVRFTHEHLLVRVSLPYQNNRKIATAIKNLGTYDVPRFRMIILAILLLIIGGARITPASNLIKRKIAKIFAPIKKRFTASTRTASQKSRHIVRGRADCSVLAIHK